jgi:hypothetical protein
MRLARAPLNLWSDFKITSRMIAVIARAKKNRNFFHRGTRYPPSSAQNGESRARRSPRLVGSRRGRAQLAPARARAGLAIEALAVEAIFGAVPASASRLASGAEAQALAFDDLGAALEGARGLL